jgi:hypothetical protein
MDRPHNAIISYVGHDAGFVYLTAWDKWLPGVKHVTFAKYYASPKDVRDWRS